MSKVKREIRRGVCMTLELKNIGMIKEANVKIDGLTVIAGENDTGKSTVGKALFLAYNSMSLEPITKDELFGSSDIHHLGRMNTYGKTIKENIFSQESFSSLSSIKILHEDKTFEYKDELIVDTLFQKDIGIASIAFVETPIVWNLQNLFRSSTDIESHLRMINERIDIPYPFLMKDLYFKLGNKREYIEDWTQKYNSNIISIINGKFIKDENGLFSFYRNNVKIDFDLIDVATGIKTFGILQVLLDNNRLNNYSLLILDEPEVHLHPKWQLEMAKIIVELVKNGVKILVNSHSPYMIQALIKYARDAKDKDIVDKSNFYLTRKDEDYVIIDNVNEELNKIFELLAEPMNEVFEL